MRSSDWQVDLVEYLINGGTVGRSQTELIKRASNKVNAPDVNAYLHALASERKVQKFIVSDGFKWSKQEIVWRATTEIHNM